MKKAENFFWFTINNRNQAVHNIIIRHAGETITTPRSKKGLLRMKNCHIRMIW